jgi:multidrug resistance protein
MVPSLCIWSSSPLQYVYYRLHAKQCTDELQPLFGAAASDVGGRKLVYIVGLGSFLIANTLLAVLPPHIALLYFLRIFQALGSCIVFSVGAGTVADITEPAKRASALAWFLMGPQLGPILGPLIGGQFATPGKWRWVFAFLTITSLPVYLAIVFCMPETLRSLVGNGQSLANQPWFPEASGRSLARIRKSPKFHGHHSASSCVCSSTRHT